MSQKFIYGKFRMRVVENVIPAQAGIQKCLKLLDPRFHGDDKKCIFHHSQNEKKFFLKMTHSFGRGGIQNLGFIPSAYRALRRTF